MTKKIQKKDMLTENVTETEEVVEAAAEKETTKKTRTKETKEVKEQKNDITVVKKYIVPTSPIWAYNGPKFNPQRVLVLSPGTLHEIVYEQSLFIGIEDGLYIKLSDGGFIIQ